MSKLRIANSSGMHCQINPDCAVAPLCALEQRLLGADKARLAVTALEILVEGADCPPVKVDVQVGCATDCPGWADLTYAGEPHDFTHSVTIRPTPRTKLTHSMIEF